MVKKQNKGIRKRCVSKGFKERAPRASKINSSTVYGTCLERLSPFGRLLALIRFLDLLKFEEVFDLTYRSPAQQPKLGHYRIIAFHMHSSGWDGMPVLSAASTSCCHHLLTICRQSWNQPEQFISQGHERDEGAGLAIVRAQI